MLRGGSLVGAAAPEQFSVAGAVLSADGIVLLREAPSDGRLDPAWIVSGGAALPLEELATGDTRVFHPWLATTVVHDARLMPLTRNAVNAFWYGDEVVCAGRTMIARAMLSDGALTEDAAGFGLRRCVEPTEVTPFMGLPDEAVWSACEDGYGDDYITMVRTGGERSVFLRTSDDVAEFVAEIGHATIACLHAGGFVAVDPRAHQVAHYGPEGRTSWVYDTSVATDVIVPSLADRDLLLQNGSGDAWMMSLESLWRGSGPCTAANAN